MFKIKGSTSGFSSHIKAETTEEVEMLIELLEVIGGEDGLRKHGLKAATIRKHQGATIAGPASYWRALLNDDLSGLVKLARSKGLAALETAEWWGVPESTLDRVKDELKKPALGRGRPNEDRVVTIRFKLTKEEAVEFNRRVDECGLTKSQFIRSRVLD